MGNQCSGGLRFSRRRRRELEVEIPLERVVQDWEKNAVRSYDLLPIEVWEHILDLVKDSGKDLLKCREVCQQLKTLSETMLEKEPEWSSDFPYINNVPLIFVGGFGETVVREFRGTKLNSVRAIRQFLKDMRSHYDQGLSPFPNGVVALFSNADLCTPSKRSIIPSHWRERRRLFRLMPLVILRFGAHIYVLEYEICEDTIESVQMLRNFFELVNLQSLTIYCRDWNAKNLRKALLNEQKEIAERQQRGDKFLGNLTDLRILGCNGIVALNYIFGSITKQLVNLYFSFCDEASTINSNGYATIMGPEDGFRPSEIDQKTSMSLNYSLPLMTPNVKYLRVNEVTEEMLDKLFPSKGDRLTSIQHLSVKLQRPFIRPLNRLMKAIDEHCASSLELLHLELSRCNIFDNNDNVETERDQDVCIDPKVKFTKLTDLTLSYALFLHEPEPLFRITEKCTVIRSVNFVSVSVHGGDFPDISSFSQPLWQRFPGCVGKIMVLYWTCPDASSCTHSPTTTAANQVNKKTSKKKQPLLKPIECRQCCYRPLIVIPRNIG